MTGLELLKVPGTTAGEIADIISEHCPPIVPANCDRLSCRECWLSWLTTGEPLEAAGPSDRRIPEEENVLSTLYKHWEKRRIEKAGPSDKQTAPDEEGLHPNLKCFFHTEGKEYKITHLGVKILGTYYSNQELMAHLGEVIFVRNGEKGYEAITQCGVSLGLLTHHRREDQ